MKGGLFGHVLNDFCGRIALERTFPIPEQLVFAAKALPHVLVWLKSPLAVMLLIKLADVPVPLSVTVCGELTVPTL
jgi:hypothetical protein